MLVNSIEYAEWAYFSPAWDESPWKGGVRNELLRAIARYMDYNTLEKALTKDGVEVDSKWERSFFDMSQGFMKGIQTNIGKRGNPTKTNKTIDKWVISSDPSEVTKMMFGPSFKPNDVMTFESSYKAILSPKFIWKKYRKEILTKSALGMSKKPFPMPPVMTKYL
jgi:hypothetical protein